MVASVNKANYGTTYEDKGVVCAILVATVTSGFIILLGFQKG